MRSYLKLCVLRSERQTDRSESVHCLNVNHLCNGSLRFMSKEGQDLFVCLSASVYLLAFCVCVGLCVWSSRESHTVTFAVKSALLATG